MTAEMLENRLIEFAAQIIGLTEGLPETRAANHIAGQLLRSGTSPAPNYAEARSAESRRDFIHKIKIALKELRETLVWLKILRKRCMSNSEALASCMQECNELISIFVSTTKTVDGGRQLNQKSNVKNQES